jgi:hypothetical protein
MDWQYSVGLQERDQATSQPPEAIAPMVVGRLWGYSGLLRCVLANAIHGSTVGYSFDCTNTLRLRVRKSFVRSLRKHDRESGWFYRDRFCKKSYVEGPQRLD